VPAPGAGAGGGAEEHAETGTEGPAGQDRQDSEGIHAPDAGARHPHRPARVRLEVFSVLCRPCAAWPVRFLPREFANEAWDWALRESSPVRTEDTPGGIADLTAESLQVSLCDSKSHSLIIDLLLPKEISCCMTNGDLDHMGDALPSG
jgi:hypothetical protein